LSFGTSGSNATLASNYDSLILNAASGSYLVVANYGNSATGGLRVYDGGTTNYATLTSSGLTVGSSTYNSTSATIAGSLSATSATISGAVSTGAITAGAITASSIALTTALAVSSGGTGAASLTANAVLLGNGTSAVQAVSPGTSGNVLTSNGSTWSSQALPSTSYYTLTVNNTGSGSASPVTYNPVGANQTISYNTVGAAPAGGSSSITTVGTLTSGSIGSGFGNINIGSNTVTAGTISATSISLSQIPVGGVIMGNDATYSTTPSQTISIAIPSYGVWKVVFTVIANLTNNSLNLTETDSIGLSSPAYFRGFASGTTTGNNYFGSNAITSRLSGFSQGAGTYTIQTGITYSGAGGNYDLGCVVTAMAVRYS
jgi:hypothetical protein